MISIRFIISVAFFISALAGPIKAVAQPAASDNAHPLAIHMKHWIAGSGAWRSANENYEPGAARGTRGWIKEYGVNWKWGPNGQHLVGEIVAITPEGKALSSSFMYAFYNPVTERVTNMQVGRKGHYTTWEDRVRAVPLAYGEPEINDGVEYAPTGEIDITRHSNVFVDADTQLSDVYKKDERGEWQLERQWRWTRVPQ